MALVHLQEELIKSSTPVTVETRFGPVRGGRAANGAATFLEVPYALPPRRFQDPQSLPADYRYEDKDYIYEASYCAQPNNDGQSAGTLYEDVVGLGKPSENPLFVNIVAPPSFPSQQNFPVKVYIHGGFLQFGSPHGLKAQAQYVAAERSEVWVNIGYRLSAFGFLACDEPRITGNYGFKDQWLAVRWIKENISSFGGDPSDIQLYGLSAGAHAVHQLLHHISRLPEGQVSPFRSAVLQSNAIILPPKNPASLRPQFQALCRAVGIDPAAPDAFAKLSDPAVVPASVITHAIETDATGPEHGTFRGCLDGDWLATRPSPMEWQRSGEFARALKAKGVRSIVVGDLTEEWYLYAIACGELHSMDEVKTNLERFYPTDFNNKVVPLWRTVPEGSPPEDFMRLFGEISSMAQVHCPVRILARDLINAGFPVLRYEIAWTPEQVRPKGYVTHSTDRYLWTLRLPILEDDQAAVARAWLNVIAREVDALEEHGGAKHTVKQILALTKEKQIGWQEDKLWDQHMRAVSALPGEV
ncbi:uncharacterized protein PHACADRAFT_252281 [Phanerochaete carnosa HHB-10118-sp]|uniref:Carboxylic ester hydrolase n=1 Tax=Phanerochaete carnosa (strain HHB-10118-sp) TaxID=650164 RepID=K5X5P4_PHACS|nr:uncharacterized protein PHACADRAFT_252281 [Phanerochaete carnosa HHB-10118-sp]EKM58177.1 hypothetical protein PHACADRAFT_252281 [Phanerochaete carnosa HHB-10118-sp]